MSPCGQRRVDMRVLCMLTWHFALLARSLARTHVSVTLLSTPACMYVRTQECTHARTHARTHAHVRICGDTRMCTHERRQDNRTLKHCHRTLKDYNSTIKSTLES